MSISSTDGAEGATERFDRLRQEHPHMGFALYALTPGGEVIFETLRPTADGLEYSQHPAATAAEAMALAFPERPKLDLLD